MAQLNLGRVKPIYRGFFDVEKADGYKVLDFITYEGVAYFCIQDAPMGTLPSDSLFFQSLIEADTAEGILAKLLTVDGAGSSLDADLLDGEQGVFFLQAINHAYDNAVSGLAATTTKGALDELRHSSNSLYNNTTSGRTSTQVQGAIDEAFGEIDETFGELTAAQVRISDLEDKESLHWTTWNQESDTYSGNPGVTPVHEAMKRCVVNAAGEVAYYLDPYDSTLKEDGSPANLTGLDGDVMVEIPQCWVKTEINGNSITWALSHKPRTGFVLHPKFRGGEVEKTYIGAYDASMYDVSASAYIDGLNLDSNLSRVDVANDKLASVSGKFPMVGLTRGEFRQTARNGGKNLEDFYQWQLTMFLFVVEYGNWNSQAVLGRGNVNRSYPASSSVQANSPHVDSGWSNGLGNQSGGIDDADGTPYISYRGVENLWGNCWTWIDGWNILDRQSYVSDNPVNYVDDTTTNYVSIGSALPVASNSAIKNWQYLDNIFLVAKVGGATTSSYIGDHLWTTTGWRVSNVGGDAGVALRAGLAACFLYSVSADRYRNLGSRLSYDKVIDV